MLPTSLYVGDSLSFTERLAAYPASAGWVLKLRLVPRVSGTAIVITASASGDDHVVSVAPATSAAWAAGVYGWSAYVEKSGARATIASGQITLAPDPATVAAGVDTRSQARKAVDDLKAALAAWSPIRKSYVVGDATITFNSTAEILRLLSHWETQLAGEDAGAAIAAGMKSPHRVYVRSARG